VARVLLLLPSATYRAADFLDAARLLDVDVVVASEQRQTLAGAMGDRALHLDLRDLDAAVEAIVGLAGRAPIDAVVAVDDQGALVAAQAATRLGFPTNSPAAVAATRDKAVMRRAFARAGVPQPAFRVVGPDDDVAAVASEIGFPCVVKPVSLSGSRGVIRADDPAATDTAAARVRRILEQAGDDACGPLVVERFVDGDEVAVEGLVRAGRLEVLAVFDKPDPLDGPYFEETIYVTPSRKDPTVLAAITSRTADAIAALGLREGPIHAELRVSGDDVFALEVAARSIGGLCSRALRFGAGVRLEELILRHALGLPHPGVGRESAASGVMMLPIPRAGVLAAVGGQDRARAVAGIAGLEITIHPGRPVQPLPEGDRYLGFLFARGATAAEVERSLRTAHGLLEIVID
jgi:biotin carboxylase